MENKEQEKVIAAQKSVKSRNAATDLEGDVLVNKDDLEVLANTKYSNTTIKKKKYQTRNLKLLWVFL